ncbi:hypothetical protein A2442_00635 [Candidatus Campbellbacteria bacterium RIFOXYC2_FULL_35_25]|uniref:Uncharacterized protein n=1 Tax=Candidatus Campbellbacteria bacterium RIFOXYC2_FULL_35_25 TaxID=1797582 RepID=A0A1F5EJ75_9BACT|nr:MAG: hypothetical protein A2442_00635 [Candidatus Campbellbacteria bacterium RIFOXYC2_FULL_35_25]
MKIVIATPLYPPEIAESAIYSKKISELLTKEGNETTVITYTKIPEEIVGVKIISINKQMPLPIRLFVYTKKLLKLAQENDIIYAQNGASVELPVAIVVLLTSKPLVINTIDEKADEQTRENTLLRYIQKFAFNKADKIIWEKPLSKPEILPFQENPKNETREYEMSWKKHTKSLMEIFKNAKNKTK